MHCNYTNGVQSWALVLLQDFMTCCNLNENTPRCVKLNIHTRNVTAFGGKQECKSHTFSCVKLQFSF